MATKPSENTSGANDNHLALLEALEKQDLPTFRDLLRRPGVDPRHKYGRPHFGTLLEIAARRPFGSDFVRVLLELVKPNVNVIVPEPIHHAAKRGHTDVLAALLADKRTKANAHDSDGQTALHYACIYVTPWNLDGYVGCVEQLMFRFAPVDVNRTDNKGFTAIHSAAKFRPAGSAKQPKAPATQEDAGGERLEDGDHASEAEDVWRARRRIIELVLQLGQDAVDLDSARAYGRSAREDLLLRFPDLKARLPLRTERLRADPHTALIDCLRDGRIDVFTALLQETDADGNPTLDPNHWFNAPLHTTCLELACEKHDGVDFVKALLNAGADPNMPNKLNQKFPIHVACERGYADILEALFNFSKVSVDPNCTDRFGNTALHYVVAVGDGENKEGSNYFGCLNVLLSREDVLVNRLNFRKKTCMHVALEHRNRKAVVAILNTKLYRLNLELTTDSGKLRDLIIAEFPDLEPELPLVQMARFSAAVAEEREIRIQLLEMMRKKQEDEVVKLLHAQPPRDLNRGDRQNSLLQYSARSGLVKATRALLAAGADPNSTVSCNRSPPAVLASLYGHSEILKVFVDPKFRVNFDVNATDMKGNSALHFAVRRQDLESVILLIKHGAEWKRRNKVGKKAFNRHNVEGLLDKCIDTNGAPAQDEDYEIILDYRLLALPPYKNNNEEEVENSEEIPLNDLKDDTVNIEEDDEDIIDCEMTVLRSLLKYSGGIDLLQHSVSASYLDLKWGRVKLFAIANLLMYVLFLLVLNYHIVENGTSSRAQEIDEHINGTESSLVDTNSNFFLETSEYIPLPASSWFLLILSVSILIREIVQCFVNFKKYRKNVENILDLSTVLVTLWIILPPVFVRRWDVSTSVYVFAIMLSCFELLLLTGRISVFARNIEMLKVVVKNTMTTLVSYVIILIAFALSFHMLFRDADPNSDSDIDRFTTVSYSIVKVIIMMTGELESGDLPLESTPAGTMVFVLFVVGVTIILLNLLIGLAVSDTQKIQDDAEKLWLRTRVEMVAEIEAILVHLHNRWPWPGRVRTFLASGTLFKPHARTKVARVRPNEKAELELGGGVACPGKQERPVKRRVLKEATRLLSGRAARWRQPDRAVLEEILEVVRRLEERPSDDLSFDFSDRPSSPASSF